MISKDDAVRRLRAYLTPEVPPEQLREGWPEDIRAKSEEPVWHYYVPPFDHVGATRCIVISQITGRILADRDIGE